MLRPNPKDPQPFYSAKSPTDRKNQVLCTGKKTLLTIVEGYVNWWNLEVNEEQTYWRIVCLDESLLRKLWYTSQSGRELLFIRSCGLLIRPFLDRNPAQSTISSPVRQSFPSLSNLAKEEQLPEALLPESSEAADELSKCLFAKVGRGSMPSDASLTDVAYRLDRAGRPDRPREEESICLSLSSPAGSILPERGDGEGGRCDGIFMERLGTGILPVVLGRLANPPEKLVARLLPKEGTLPMF